jgi:hypothetical protein
MRLSFTIVLNNEVDVRLSAAEEAASYTIKNTDSRLLGFPRIVVEHKTLAEAQVLLSVIHHVEVYGVCDETFIIDSYEASKFHFL